MARQFNLMQVNGVSIRIEGDYICLTDMAKAKEGQVPSDVIKNWLRTKDTIDYLGLWENLNNPTQFNVVEFHHIRNNKENYTNLSISEWVDKTQAIGIYSIAGKTGGTFAHRDIATEFGGYISVAFKMYVIKEFQRLKDIENNIHNVEWGIRRFLSKSNYTIQTDAVKNHKIPNLKIPSEKASFAYAEEADILSLAQFGFTSKKWREHNLDLAVKNYNIRDFCSINELTILSSLEVINAEMMKENIIYSTRLEKLKKIASEQLVILNKKNESHSLRKNSEGNFQTYLKNDNLGMFPAKADKSLIDLANGIVK